MCNVTSVTAQGNAAATTTTFNDTQNGSSTFPEALGKPVTITDNASYIWHLRCDNYYNLTGVADLIGPLLHLQTYKIYI